VAELNSRDGLLTENSLSLVFCDYIVGIVELTVKNFL
jgi:hypothetical protein